jgi:hypothetical protein
METPGVNQKHAQIRIARPTDKRDQVVGFYHDGLGFPIISQFEHHAGYSGVMFGMPTDQVHLEFTHEDAGRLLLVFYLLVDKSNTPIIVDQPEENLDSQTVYRLLIPVIKEVKKRRQIIMVTHSPNIAVVCDAEQIIHAFIDRENGNRVIYTMGAIESPQINKYLVDVLEGTRPAFDNRGSKYYAS